LADGKKWSLANTSPIQFDTLYRRILVVDEHNSVGPSG